MDCPKVLSFAIYYQLMQVIEFLQTRCNGSSDRSFMVNPLSYFSFQPVLHGWCNKVCGVGYPLCGMVHIKEPLLLNGKSSPYGGSWFPLSLSEWSFSDAI